MELLPADAPAEQPPAAEHSGAAHAAWAAHLRSPPPLGSMLWSLLGSGVAQWEVAHRDAACPPSPEVDAAHWRALQSLCQLALAVGVESEGPDAALRLLRRLASGDAQPPAEARLATDVVAALAPSLLQLQVPPLGAPYDAAQDPFALLLALFAELATPPPAADGADIAVHARPAEVLAALVASLLPAAAGQAAALALAGPAAGARAHSASDAAAAMAASPPLARALEGAAASQLLPWLRRAALLLDLSSGRAAPAGAAGAPAGAPAAAAAELLQRLGLPPLADALRSRAAGCLAPPPGSACPARGGAELSVLAAGRQWVVRSPPPPSPAQLLQLPASYQAWFLSLGSQPCSVCGQAPAEPALCLRCGAMMCCADQRCRGPGGGHRSHGMCFTHSQACGGGTCCFLLARATRLLVVRKMRATLLASPYVDGFGEEDVNLARGKPLSLHAERLHSLLQLWRGGAFDFDSLTLRNANVHVSAQAF